MFAVPGESTAGDDAVDVDMLSQCLAPGVQNHDDAQFGPEVFRVSSEGLEGLGGGVERNRLDPPSLNSLSFGGDAYRDVGR